ncbi:MAG: hypothetical protein WBD40_14765 [Tepidisphaeraceae bacterium]
MAIDFRWNDWNLNHIAEHGVTIEEAEHVVEHADAGYPEPIGDGKYRVRGQSRDGRYLQAVYIYDPAAVVYVIHARDLADREKRNLRRRRR